jgi:hypothetical protein
VAPAPVPFYQRIEEIVKKKNVFAEEVFVNCYNFNPYLGQHASIQVKEYLYSSQKRKFSRYVIIEFGVGAGAEAAISDLRLREAEAGAERNIFSAPQHREYR